jgi:hypothetical protein
MSENNENSVLTTHTVTTAPKIGMKVRVKVLSEESVYAKKYSNATGKVVGLRAIGDIGFARVKLDSWNYTLSFRISSLEVVEL